MSLLAINNGTFDNDGGAEKVRTAFDKINTMFGEIYGKVPFDLPDGVQGYILKVKTDRTGFELVELGGGGDMLSSNNLGDLTNAAQARLELGLGSASTEDVSNLATNEQGDKADTALQSVDAGTGISIDITDPQNPVITNSETNDYLSSVSFDPSTGIVTFALQSTGTVTLDLSDYTVLKIDGYQVKKGSGNTNLTTIEVGDYCRGWDGDRDVAFRVNALPYTTESNRDYATNNSI